MIFCMGVWAFRSLEGHNLGVNAREDEKIMQPAGLLAARQKGCLWETSLLVSGRRIVKEHLPFQVGARVRFSG